MATIEVELTDHLSAEDMRRIAQAEFAEVCRSKSQADFERILSNAAYELVRREVDAVFDGKMVEQVREKAVSVIGSMSAMTVFKRPDAWDREASKGWTHLQTSIDEAQPAIAARVHEIIQSMDSSRLSDLIEDRIGIAILEKLTAPAVSA